MKNIIVALLVAFATPAHADDLGDFIHKITDGSTQSRAVKHHAVKHAERDTSPQSGNTGIRALVNEVAAKHHVRSGIVHAISKIESTYNCRAKNHDQWGIMQVKRATAASVGVYGNLLDCRTGLEAGVLYLKASIAMHGDNCVAYSAYNSGLRSNSCTGYGRRVMRLSSSR